MNVIFEHIHNTKRTLVILREPEKRTMFLNRYTSIVTLSFPYVVHVVTIDNAITPINHGIWGKSHYVFFSDKPITSITDDVYFSPLEYYRHGLTCTSHDLDGLIFKSQKALVYKIINSWYSSLHEIHEEELYEWMKNKKCPIIKKANLQKHIGESHNLPPLLGDYYPKFVADDCSDLVSPFTCHVKGYENFKLPKDLSLLNISLKEFFEK